MNHNRAKDWTFGLGVLCSVTLIAAVMVGAVLATESFVTQYSVLAGRAAYVGGR